MERIFRVRGRVVCPEGDPLAHVTVALVDRDPVFDDLLGYGQTHEDGTFRLDFTTRAFNQERFEHERTPDLYAVCSGITHHSDGDEPVVLLQADFSHLRWDSDEGEDLGDLCVAVSEPPPRELRDAECIPGLHKRAPRVELTDALVARALDEVAPVVESLTGWSDLRDGITVRVVRGLGPLGAAELRAVLPDAPADPVDRLLGLVGPFALTQFYRYQGMFAAYMPATRVIAVDQTMYDTQGYDGLKVALGHELAHAGQFKNHPEILEEHVRYGRASTSDDPDEVAAAARAHGELKVTLEGHASHIEHDFLRRIYNLAGRMTADTRALRAMRVTHDLVDRVARRARGGARDSEGDAPAVPASQRAAQEFAAPYALGLRLYRARRVGSEAVRFDPSLRREVPAGGAAREEPAAAAPKPDVAERRD